MPHKLFADIGGNPKSAHVRTHQSGYIDNNRDNRKQYRMEFFKSGIISIIKMWLKNGCKETPEEMAEIIKSEYRGRDRFFNESDMAD